ncbi:MAG: hypothetical protein E6987_01525 [Peptoniphilus harei]|nr:hypothetical protein [Peptoniphilus harei]
MKVKVLKEFHDKKENITRKPGDVFTCSKERYEEIEKTLKLYCVQCQWIEVVEDGPSIKASKKSAGNNDRQ